MYDDVRRLLKNYPAIRGRLVDIFENYEVPRSYKIFESEESQTKANHKNATATHSAT